MKGVEPDAIHSVSAEKLQCAVAGGVKTSLPLCPPMVADADLRAVVEAWATLPATIRAGIMAMIRATNGG